MLLVAPFAAAQEDPIVAVVSLGSYNDMMKSAQAMGEMVGFPNVQKMMEEQINGMTGGKGLAGVDKTKPLAMILRLAKPEPYAVVCIPVTDVNQMLGALPGPMGETQDAGDGVKHLPNTPQPMYLKDQNGWALLAQEKEHLAGAPDNPQELLGDLPTTYLIGARAFIQNVPEEQRYEAIGFLEMMTEMGLAEAEGTDEEIQLQRNLVKRQIKLMRQWIDETDEVTIGLGMDAATQDMHLDFSMTAVTGSKTAIEYARFKNTPSAHSGFLRDDAAISVAISAHGERAEEDLELLDAQHRSARARAIGHIDGDAGVPDAIKDDVKEALGQLIDVGFNTMKSENFEAGMAAMANDKSTIVVGGSVSDGNALEAAIKKLVDIVGKEEDVPPIQWDAENHGFYRIHVMRMPVPDEDAKALMGDQLEVAMAVNANSCYLAIGGNSVAEVKTTIDAATAGKDKAIEPFQAAIKLGPLMTKFADQDPTGQAAQLAGMLKDGGEIQLNAVSIPNGFRGRLLLQKNVIKAIGSMGMMMAGGLGGGAAGGPPPF
jgi:hypothetical protein